MSSENNVGQKHYITVLCCIVLHFIVLYFIFFLQIQRVTKPLYIQCITTNLVMNLQRFAIFCIILFYSALSKFIYAASPAGIEHFVVVVILLFKIHINDFPLLIRKYSHIIRFADDTSTLTTSYNYAQLNQNLNFRLQYTSKWFKINQLVLNTCGSLLQASCFEMITTISTFESVFI